MGCGSADGLGVVVFREIRLKQEYAPVAEQDECSRTGGGCRDECFKQEDQEERAMAKAEVAYKEDLDYGTCYSLCSPTACWRCHVGTFSNLWFVFLSTPRYDLDNSHHTVQRSADACTSSTPQPLENVPPRLSPSPVFLSCLQEVWLCLHRPSARLWQF